MDKNGDLPIKILIVDDEMLVRIGISSLVDWEKHGFRIIGSAGNGMEALEIIERELPDILLTDIIMPKMDGIELLKVIHQKYGFIRTIVLSCHDDFDYVKTAIKLGAEDYVLKLTMTPDEILTLLLGIADEIRKDIRENSFIKPDKRMPHVPDDESKADLMRCLLDNSTDMAFIKDTLHRVHPALLNEYKLLVLIKVHSPPSAAITTNKVHEKGLIQLIEAQLSSDAPELISVCFEQQNTIALFFTARTCVDMQSRICGIMRYVIVSARRFMNISVSIGVGNAFLDIASLRNAYFEASDALMQSFYSEKEGVFTFSDEFFLNDKNTVLSPEEELELFEIIENCRIPTVTSALTELFEKIEGSKLNVDICRKILLEIICCFIASLKKHGKSVHTTMGDTLCVYRSLLGFDRFTSAKEFTLRCADEYITARHTGEINYRREIREIIEYLQNHYQEPVSLKWAAQYVHMSESHLSRLFKEETGKSFIQYLNELRLKKAATLLDTTELPGYLISEMVGYDNPNYFGRVFKKSIGISPTLFKKRKKQQ